MLKKDIVVQWHIMADTDAQKKSQGSSMDIDMERVYREMIEGFDKTDRSSCRAITRFIRVRVLRRDY